MGVEAVNCRCPCGRDDKSTQKFENCENISRIWITHIKEIRTGSIYELKEMLPDKEIVLAKDGMEVNV